MTLAMMGLMMVGACGDCGFFGGRCDNNWDSAAPPYCPAAAHLGEVIAAHCAGTEGYPATHTDTLALQAQEFTQYLALEEIGAGFGEAVVRADACTSAVQTAADCPALLTCMTTAGVTLPAQLPEPPAEGQFVDSVLCGRFQW